MASFMLNFEHFYLYSTCFFRKFCIKYSRINNLIFREEKILSKKFFVSLIAVFVLLVSVSSAMSAEYAYVLKAIEEGTTAPADPEIFANDLEEGYSGYNFKARYRLPQLGLYLYNDEDKDDEDKWTLLKDYTISWDIASADHTGISISERIKDSTSDILVLKGVLPEVTALTQYKILLEAKVMSITDSRYSPAVGVSTKDYADGVDGNIAIDINPDDHKKATEAELKTFVVSYDKTAVETVSSDYSVTVNTTKDSMTDKFNEYIQSDDEYRVNLPEWLTCTVNNTDAATPEDFDAKQATSVTIKFNQDFKDTLQDGEKAVVRIPLIKNDNDTVGPVLAWDVTFTKPKPAEKPAEPSTPSTPPAQPTTPTESSDITSQVALTDESGASTAARPFDSLQPGNKATYGISLAGTNITAATWVILINGTQSHTITPSSFKASDAATSWAEISEATSTSAKVTANPPSDLSSDSAVSVSITGTDGKTYTIDLGTVKAATTTNGNPGPSNGGCDSGFGALTLALIATTLLRAHKKH